MPRRALAVGVCAVIVVLVLPGPAAAGGWWTYPQMAKSPVGVGETAVVRAEVMFATAGQAQAAADDEFHAFLVRGIDHRALRRAMARPEPLRRWAPPEHMTRIGHVVLSHSDSNVVTATARGRIPAMEPGRYSVMLCDAGCVHPLADVIPASGIRVVASPVLARAVRRVTALELRADADQRTLQRRSLEAQSAATAATTKVDRLSADLDRLSTDVDRLNTRVDTLAAAQRPRSAATWPGALGWFLAAAAALAAVISRRRPPTPRGVAAADTDEWERPRHLVRR